MRTSVLLVAALVSFGATAQNTFSTIIDQIINNNAALKSQYQLVESQRCDDSDANSLANPEVEFTRVWGKDGIGNKLQLDVSQSFDWPGLYRARQHAAQQGQVAALQQLQSDALDLAVEAKQRLVELVYVRKQLTLTDSILSNIQRLNAAVDKSLEHGEITVLDQRKTTYEAFKYQNQAATLHAREQEICSELQALCTAELNFADIVEYPLEVLRSNQEYLDEIAKDPGLLAQAMNMETEELNAKVARQSRMPGFSLGYEHQAEMGDSFNGLTAAMTLPFFENRKARQAAFYRKDAAEMASISLRADLEAQVHGQLDALELWRTQIDSFRKVFGDNLYLQYITKAYDAGQLNVIEYITEVNYYQEQTFTYLETEYNYYNSLSWLNRYQLLQ